MGKMTTANKLTLLRIVMIPFFIYFMYNLAEIGRVIAAVIFVLAAITDFLDGYLARKNNEVTNFGKIFDPIADKILVLSALIPLVEFNMLAGWVVIVILAREFIIGGFRNVVAAQGGKVIAASYLGKIKTITQIVMIVTLLIRGILLPFIPPVFEDITIYASIILALWSMVDYLYNGAKQLKNLGE